MAFARFTLAPLSNSDFTICASQSFAAKARTDEPSCIAFGPAPLANAFCTATKSPFLTARISHESGLSPASRMMFCDFDLLPDCLSQAVNSRDATIIIVRMAVCIIFFVTISFSSAISQFSAECRPPVPTRKAIFMRSFFFGFACEQLQRHATP